MVNSIEVDHLDVARGGRTVLSDMSFAVAEGTVTGLLGPSGSRKTTLIRSIVGVQRISGGSVRVLSLSAGERELRRAVGYLTQAPSVYRDLTVRENLGYFAAVLGVGATRVDEVIADTSLTDESGARVDRLSGGQQSRVSLATALLGRPRILLLDEPTTGLDPVLREELWLLFHRLVAEGVTLLVSSHVMEEATRCQRLLLVRDGRLLVDDTPEGLLRSTGEPDMDKGVPAFGARRWTSTMSARRTVATAVRVLAQLRRDPRTIAMLLVVPLLLMLLLRYAFAGSVAVFDHIAPILIAVFPFILMFLITSVAMLRERTSGTLERLLTMPIAKLDLLVGMRLHSEWSPSSRSLWS